MHHTSRALIRTNYVLRLVILPLLRYVTVVSSVLKVQAVGSFKIQLSPASLFQTERERYT